jgi:hypothetical protein
MCCRRCVLHATIPACVQVVSVFSSFGFQWPVQLTTLFAASSMSTFNEQLMAPECSVGSWSFELKSVSSPRTHSMFLHLAVLRRMD